jgi:hypothetical protein
VRIASFAALALALVALAGCTGSDDGGAAWDGPPEPAGDGTVSVEDFVAYQDDVDERWELAAETVATEFLRLDERTASRTTIAGTSEGEGDGPRTVVVTFEGLFDDSVRAERWTLQLQPHGDAFGLESGVRTFRCHPGRGHEDFAPEPCA